MSDEGREAIERLKDLISKSKVIGDIEINKQVAFKDIEMILNLIEKQQKEIEELKEDNKHQWEERCKLTFELENSTSNDKIKAKIKELEKLNDKSTGIGYWFAIYYLQSLLEKE